MSGRQHSYTVPVIDLEKTSLLTMENAGSTGSSTGSTGSTGSTIDLPKATVVSNDNIDTLDDSWENRLLEYTMGVMSPAESLEFERQLNECRAHVKLADDYSQVVGWVGASVPAAEPPAGHKDRLMKRVAASSQEITVAAALPTTSDTAAPAPLASAPATPPRPAPLPRAATAPPIAVAEEDKPPSSVTDLSSYRKSRMLSRRIALVSSLAAALVLLVAGAWLYSILSKPYVPAGYTAVMLQPQNSTVKGSVVAFVNPGKNDVVLLGSGLEQLPAQKVYELWVMPAAGKPQAAGTFTPGQDGQARHNVQVASNMRDYASVAVTIEDAPGVQQPTTPPILVGKTGTQ